METQVEQDELFLLRALLRASDYGVLLSDGKRRDLICNQRFCDMFWLEDMTPHRSEPEYLRGRVLPRLKDPERFTQTLDRIYADPRMVHEDEVELSSPRHRILRRYTAPITDEAGHPVGRLWTFLDITQTRKLENKVEAQAAQLRVQARQLAAALKATHGRLNKVENVLNVTQQQLFESEKLSAVGLVAASVAHDIRNILTPLTIEMTLADQDDPAMRQESFDMMRRQIDRLSLLTHRLLALAKPATGEHDAIDFHSLVNRLDEVMRPQAAQEQISLQIKCSRSLPEVKGDAVQIDQVLVNLILNALQAMHGCKGGALSLTVAPRDGGVAIRIADTGPGIPAKVRRRLFDPFFTTRREGAGLGLFSCHRIIEAHGGAIRVRSAAGKGASFTIWLPGGDF